MPIYKALLVKLHKIAQVGFYTSVSKCSHDPLTLLRCSPWYKALRMLFIRSLIVTRSCNHWSKRVWLLRIVAMILAPYEGQDVISALDSWVSNGVTFTAVSASSATM